MQVDHHHHQTSSGHNIDQKYSQKKKFFINYSVLIMNNIKGPFRVITTTLLSLLLPLSFLLLARLSSVRFVLSLTSFPSPEPSTFFSIFLCTNPALLYSLVSTVSISTLIHNLTGNKLTLLSPSSSSDHHDQNYIRRPRLYASWFFLCTLQVCVGLGIEGSVALGTDYSFSSFNGTDKRTLFSRVIFFLGLHETMIHWSRLGVRPVVDDTIFGVVSTTEKWVQRGAMAGGFTSLWYWRMRDEIESLVVVAEIKGEMSMAVGLGDFAGWWLYYLTVTVGMVRLVKGLMWVGMSLFCCRRSLGLTLDDDDDENHDHEDKV
ncbi:hypothetical protein L484_009740 [Morus notabilis]|uniref:Transmembrane protein n=1 Tax=Morus notabilis TaxID=981085 RepID=W9QXY8_9ROSA|nr:uncharacterized protein LOC21393059 [Morus notabilis]EXB28581.1 hypothetical protein L484_009740 [Morus notabilis]